MNKIIRIFVNALPVLIMIGLIPLIQNDYVLTLVDALIILACLAYKRVKNDFLSLVFGFFMITFFEYIFVSTGVETFNRNTLFGIMPLWLPVLWAYGFVAIKRSIEILNADKVPV